MMACLYAISIDVKNGWMDGDNDDNVDDDCRIFRISFQGFNVPMKIYCTKTLLSSSLLSCTMIFLFVFNLLVFYKTHTHTDTVTSQYNALGRDFKEIF